MKWTLQKLTTSSGYLQTCPIDFAPGLNCIIGARGTCKSTIVETIRFVFDCEPSKIESMISPPSSGSNPNGPFARAGLLLETLAGGTAKCTFAASDDPSQSKYIVERNIPVPSRVYRDGVQQIDDATLLHRIEIFSQGDLQTIAERPDRRLALIDRPNQKRVEELSHRLQELTKELQALGPQIRQQRSEIESKQAKVQSLEPTRKQLAELQSSRPSLSPELEAERVASADRRRAFEQLKVATHAYARAIGVANSLLLEEAALRDATTLATGLHTPAASALASSFGALLNTFSQVRTTVDQAASVEASLAKVAEEFEAQNAKYYELRKDQQSVNEALKVEESLRQAIAAMEAVANDLSDVNAKQSQDMAKREDLRRQRDALADELYALRMAQVEKINSEFGEQIVLTLEQGVLTAPHRKLIEELLQRSNLRNQADVARDLAEKVRPSDLVDIIEVSDAKRLSDALGRDLGQMTRLVSHLLDSSRLYELEEIVPQDNLEITMLVRGEPRPIEHLSKGQMATALLPLILRDAEYPLLVDQPEDDLDNAFVSEKLIDRLKALSMRRQLIFVTHNANIPVLGEAERVTVMEMDGPRKALPCQSGSVDAMKDAIIRLLEGGKAAFKGRQHRYGNALR
jgi:chromosome segregation ATPase